MKGLIQSVIFSKDKWTLETSKKWLKRRSRKFKNVNDVDETSTSYRFRQIEPSEFNKYRTIKKNNGIDFVIGYTSNKDGGTISLRNSAQKFLPDFTWAEYPGEHHLPPIDGLKWNFYGPGTDLRERLKDIDSGIYEPKSFSEPTCAVDSAAYIHDVRYLLADGDLEKQHEADLEMVENLKHIKPKSSYEAFARWLGIGIMNAKVKLGMGVEDETMNKLGYGLESNEEFEKDNINFNELAKEDGSL
jgi:hypothetical protein